MLSTQQILQAAIDMQRNAQQALPVIPNNGNPMGANNMPQNIPRTILPQTQAPVHTGGYDSSGINPAAGRGDVPASPTVERFPWLKPSSSMDNIRRFLSERRTNQQVGGMPSQPVLPNRM